MKTLNLIIAVTIFISISSIGLNAQTTSTWVGGKAGRPTDWNCTANWKEGRLPDELSQVIIPAGRAFYPVIKNEVASIDALMVEGTATLKLEKSASLTVLGESGRLNVVSIFGMIDNEGLLDFHNSIVSAQVLNQHIQGNGLITDKTLIIASK